jgi:glycosyltransferase involved in cell wall biosynthesis
MSRTGIVSVIIPAHNEEAVIGRTLTTLLQSADAGEFEVIVVCNGCRDRTADIAGTGFADVVVVELEEASKTAAINAGLRQARGGVVLLLDADIELQTPSARALAEAACQPGVEIAIGHMDVDTEGADLMVRAFYRVWMEHPYLRNGKFAAAIALSRAGLERIGTMPRVTADDTYLRRLFPVDRVAVVDSVHFQVRAPRNVAALVRVRSRSYRGNRQLAASVPARDRHPGEARGLLRRLLRKPSLWPSAPAYLAVTLVARSLSYRDSGTRWERDLTTRTPLTEQGV